MSPRSSVLALALSFAPCMFACAASSSEESVTSDEEDLTATKPPAYVACAGAGLDDAALLARLPAGRSSLEILGKLTADHYTRTCVPATGCSAWTKAARGMNLSIDDTGTAVTMTAVQASHFRSAEREFTATFQAGATRQQKQVDSTRVESEAKITGSCMSLRHALVRKEQRPDRQTEEVYLYNGPAPVIAERFPAEPPAWRCAAAPLPREEVIPLFAPGTATLAIGDAAMPVYTRSCSKRTACSKWQSSERTPTRLWLQIGSRSDGSFGVDMLGGSAAAPGGTPVANVDAGATFDQKIDSRSSVGANASTGCAGWYHRWREGEVTAKGWNERAVAGQVNAPTLR